MSMIDPTSQASDASRVDPSLVTYTHVIYALHALSILIGLTGAVSVIGAFLFGVPSILGVILNYVRRPDVRGTWLESHFRWQIRTFWLAFAWAAGGALLAVTVILLPVSLAIWGLLTLWVGYRVLRGWLKLRDGEGMAF